MKAIRTYFSRGVCLMALAVAVVSACVRETSSGHDYERIPKGFSVCVEDGEEVIQTKSLLTASDIETKITSVTVAVYDVVTGERVGLPIYKTNAYDGITLELEPGSSVAIYAVANMGDMSASFPSSYSASAFEGITYRIPGYTTSSTGVNARGIPMAGSLSYTEGTSTVTTIPLKRLMSKLSVHVTCGWPGTFNTVRIYNLNGSLKPFGASVAASADDILDEQEIDVLDVAAKEGDFVFYLPENLQGTISSITASKDKSHDNGDVSGADLKTYLEVSIQGDGSSVGVEGTLTYRSYLGGNSTSNFDIVRNSRYSWSVDYLPGNMQNNDWKHENGLSWKTFDYSFSAPGYIYYNEENAATFTQYASRYQNGAFVSRGSDSSTIPTVDFSISSGNGTILGNGHASGRNYFYFTGLSAGVGTVSVFCTDPFNKEGVRISRDVRVLDFGREIFLRMPNGNDYYSGDVIPIAYGSTLEGIKVGMRKRYANGSTQIICPIVIESDNLNSVNVHYPSYGKEVLDLNDFSGDAGKQAVFSHTFNEKKPTSSYQSLQFTIFSYYTDYGSNWRQLSARMTANILDVDTEVLSISGNKESAYWIDDSITLSASSTPIHNGQAGSATDITSSGDYTWTISPTSGFQLNQTTKVLTASKAGSVTVTVKKNSDPSITASKTFTFNDKTTWRLNIVPNVVNIQVNNTFSYVNDLTWYKVKYVNGVNSGESVVYTGTSKYADIVSGYTEYLSYSSTAKTVKGKKEGTGYVRLYSYASDFDSDYNEQQIEVRVGAADVWTVEVSPSSASKKVNETQTFTATVKKNGVAQSVDASKISWKSSSTTKATVSPSSGASTVATAKDTGSATITATYDDGDSSHKCSGTATLSISAADVITYKYKVVTTVSPTAIQVGGQATASARRQKMTYVNGQPTTGWVDDGDVTSSGFKAQSGGSYVSISGSTITGTNAGTASIRSNYSTSIDEYDDATFTVSAADVWTVEISPSSASKQVGQTQVFTATVKKNGVVQSVSGSSIAWTIPTGSGYASLSASTGTSVTATANAEGTATIKARYTSGTIAAEATATLTVSNVVTYQYRVVTTVSPTSIQVGGQATASAQRQKKTIVNGQATTDWVNDGDVTGSGFSAQSGGSYVTISGSTVTGAAAGTATIRSNYNTNVSSYQDATITVTNAPLTLSYPDGVPTYVAQRGLLKASGVTGSGTTVSYSVTSGSNKVRLVANGNNTYVELLSSGSYTIKATASNGQSGEYSGSVTAPVLTLSTNSLNANPDGTVAKTGTFGLDGSTLSVSYKSGDETVTFGTSGNAIVTGNYLHTSLYNELLAPQYSSNNSIITATADGIYANDVYTPSTSTLATVTVAPKVSSTGVSSRAVTVKGVNPFSYWTGSLSNMVNDLPDEEDFGLVNAYHQFHYHSYTSHTATFERIMATVTRCGIAVLRNGNALPEGALNSCFTSSLVSNSWKTTYTLSEAALSEHIGGEIALRGYVRNYYSNNYVYSNGGHSFRLYVNGAVGAKMEGAGTSVVKISTAWAGAEGSYAFGQMAGLGQAKFVTTDYNNGHPFSALTNTTVQNVVPEGAPLGVVVYELHREGATIPAAQVKGAERPRFKFNSISTLGVFVDDVELEAFYFLAPPGTPTFYDDSIKKEHGYYKLYLLENLEIQAMGGWVD